MIENIFMIVVILALLPIAAAVVLSLAATAFVLRKFLWRFGVTLILGLAVLYVLTTPGTDFWLKTIVFVVTYLGVAGMWSSFFDTIKQESPSS